MPSAQSIAELENCLMKMPVDWDARTAILEMKNAEYPHWRQMEWIGFYFQFLCEKMLPMMAIPGPTFDRVEFDGFFEIPWDFKVHPKYNAKGVESDEVIANDLQATIRAIEKFGSTGLILALGEARYNDKDRSFQVWHQGLKGGLSDFERERILRKAPSRLRKTAFRLDSIALIVFDGQGFQRLLTFQEGFRNSNGKPRKAKVLVQLKGIRPIKIIHFPL